MSSHVLDKVSFWSLFLVVVLLPVFFFPFTRIPFETAKGFLLVLGLVVSIVFWGVARFAEGKISLPKSLILFSGFIFSGVYLTSAYFSVAREVSFFGTMLDSGSAFFILAAILLLTICAINIKSLKSAKVIILGLILSSTLLFIFQIIHLFFPSLTTLGLLTNKTDNIMGTWSALALYAAFFSIISIFIIEFFNIPKLAKLVLGVFMALAIFLMMVANFYLAWALLEAFAMLIFVYKMFYFLNKDNSKEIRKYFPYNAFVVFIISLTFFIFSQSFGGYLANRLKASNLEATPSYSANFSVAKAVTLDKPLLGIGPNRFGQAWSMHKNADINSSLFWNNYFDAGAGFLPTLATTIGYVGAGAMLLFLFVYLLAGIRAMVRSIKDGSNWDAVFFFLASFFLFTSTALYPTGPVIFLLAMAFTGIFIGVTIIGKPQQEFVVVFSNNPKKSFFFLFVLIGIMLSSATLGFKFLERFASVPAFQTAATNISNSSIAIPAIEKAVALHPNDLYYRTAAQVYLVQFSTQSTKGASLTEAEKTLLPGILEKAISNAISATTFDKNNYLNFQMLATVYSSAGQLGVQASFDKALEAYKQASVLNPLNPSIKLSMARMAFALSKPKEAEDYTSQALTLKPDFIDGLIVMSQIKQTSGDMVSARTYGEQALSYVEAWLASFPTDENYLSRQKDLKQYLSELNKNTNNTSTPDKTKTTNKPKSSTKNN